MSIPTDLDKPFFPSQGEIRDNFITDLRLGYIEAGNTEPATEPGTEPYIRAKALDNFAQALFANNQIASNNASETTATGDALDAIREAIGLAEVPASPSAGKLIVTIAGSSNRTFQNGLQFIMANGKRGQVSGTQPNIANGGSVNVVAIDFGEATNQDPGAKVRWVSPPLNVATEAIVDNDGLTGGTDNESDSRKRERIINRRKFLPASGNWAHFKETAEATTSAIQSAFIFCALGGPSTVKVVVIKSTDVDNLEFSRVVPDATVNAVRGAIFGEMPSPIEIAVTTVTDELIDLGIQLSLPDAATSGRASGWKDLTPFPQLVSADNGRVRVSAVTDSTHITISANTNQPPVAGANSIAWFDSVAQKFIASNITNVSGGAGAYVLTLDTPLVSGANTVLTGDFISANPTNVSDYRDTWLEQMNLLGPGENTSNPNVLAANRQRGFRRPYTSDTYPSDIGLKQLAALQVAHPEVLNASYSYSPKTTPTVPFLISTSPNVLRLRHLAFYPL